MRQNGDFDLYVSSVLPQRPPEIRSISFTSTVSSDAAKNYGQYEQRKSWTALIRNAASGTFEHGGESEAWQRKLQQTILDD